MTPARRRLCSSGQLRRITHGVYVVAEAAPATFAEQRRQYLQRAGALMAALPDTYLVGPSACLAHSLPLLNPPSAIHLSRERQLHSNRAGVVSRRPWPHSVEPVDGLMTQQATAAVIEVAALEGTLAGLVPADVAARRGLLLDTDALLDAWGRRRGNAHARAALASRTVDASRCLRHGSRGRLRSKASPSTRNCESSTNAEGSSLERTSSCAGIASSSRSTGWASTVTTATYGRRSFVRATWNVSGGSS